MSERIITTELSRQDRPYVLVHDDTEYVMNQSTSQDRTELHYPINRETGEPASHRLFTADKPDKTVVVIPNSNNVAPEETTEFTETSSDLVNATASDTAQLYVDTYGKEKTVFRPTVMSVSKDQWNRVEFTTPSIAADPNIPLIVLAKAAQPARHGARGGGEIPARPAEAKILNDHINPEQIVNGAVNVGPGDKLVVVDRRKFESTDPAAIDNLLQPDAFMLAMLDGTVITNLSRPASEVRTAATGNKRLKHKQKQAAVEGETVVHASQPEGQAKDNTPSINVASQPAVALNSVSHKHVYSQPFGPVPAPQVVPSASHEALERLRALKSNPDNTQGAVNARQRVGERYVMSDVERAARDAYNSADQELATQEAHRYKIGMFAFKKSRERANTELDSVARAYADQTGVFDAIQEAKYRTMMPDMSDAELAQKMANYHTAKLRLHKLRTEEEFNTTGKFGKLSEWHDKLSAKYSKLGRKEKIIFAIGVGATSIVVGGVLASVGAGVSVAGAGVMAGAKLYKTYMQSRADLYARDQDVTALPSADSEGVTKSTAQLQEEALERMQITRQARIEKTDRINKRARVTMAIGATALIGGGAAHFVQQNWSEIQGVFHSMFDHNSNLPDTQMSAGSDPDLNPHHEYTFHHETTSAPAQAPAAPEVHHFNPDAYRVDTGQGWYETFSRMGIGNPTEQANLLQKVGPELVKRGIAYPMGDGTLGISRPGMLSQDVLELIQNSR